MLISHSSFPCFWHNTRIPNVLYHILRSQLNISNNEWNIPNYIRSFYLLHTHFVSLWPYACSIRNPVYFTIFIFQRKSNIFNLYENMLNLLCFALPVLLFFSLSFCSVFAYAHISLRDFFCFSYPFYKFGVFTHSANFIFFYKNVCFIYTRNTRFCFHAYSFVVCSLLIPTTHRSSSFHSLKTCFPTSQFYLRSR